MKRKNPEMYKLYREISSKYNTYEARGNIYTMFYEKALELLKDNGVFAFITSNKWMRAVYGSKLRNYFVENSNPLLLIDLGAGIFDSATVDTNILISEKAQNAHQLRAVTLSADEVENMSDYVKQNVVDIDYRLDEPWTILSAIEHSIKKKIESVGTPLKEWNIKINRGILTGLNEAFIISKEKRDELVNADPKSDEIIRPILRGKDIKRYEYDFQNLYLINTHNGYVDENGNTIPPINIDDYPAVKDWLDSEEWNKNPKKGNSFKRLSERTDQGVTPYNLRSLAYMDDFSKPKIIWKIIGNQLAFAIDNNEQLVNNACYILTGNFLEYLVIFLNSKAIYWYSDITNMNKTGTGDVQIGAQNIALFPIPKPNNQKQQPFIELLNNITTPTNNEQDQKSNELKLIDLVNNIYGFSLEETDFLNNYEG